MSTKLRIPRSAIATGLVSLALGLGAISNKAQTASQSWKMPWPSNTRGPVSQTWHTDGYGRPAIDIGLNAGTPVLAPVDSTVVSTCIARGTSSHRAIKLRSNDGKEYSLIHVNATNVSNGKSYRQGEQIGTVAADKPNDPKCAVSTGIHLHLGLPSKTFSIDGYNFTSSYPPLNTSLRSSNGTSTSTIAFASNAWSQLTINSTAVNLSLGASNLRNQRVYVQMWRPAHNGYPAREWNYNKVAGDASITFSDLDGPGNVFTGVDYYTVASLTPISSGQAALRRTSCFSATGGQQLCDRIKR